MSAAVDSTASRRRPDAAAEQLKREAARLWEADRVTLMLRQPFVAMLAMRLDLIPVVDDRRATACTDGERIFVNAHFLHGLNAADRAFVLAHEVWHCAARHFLRRGSREPERWNIVADHEVNALLRDEGLRLPAGCVYFPDLHGENAETVYASDACEQVLETGRGRLADQHMLGSVSGNGLRDPDLDAFDTAGDWDQWPARVVAVAQQLERLHGRLPGNIHQLIESYRKPAVPWRDMLVRFVTRTLGDERAWLPPNRRWIHRGLYLPSRRGQRLEITVAIDTSASTTEYLPIFLGELIGLATSFGRYRLRLIFCDTEIQQEQVISDEAPWEPEKLDFVGAGGTSLTAVFTHLAHETPPAYPVLWALTPGGRVPTYWGEALHLACTRS